MFHSKIRDSMCVLHKYNQSRTIHTIGNKIRGVVAVNLDLGNKDILAPTPRKKESNIEREKEEYNKMI